MSQRPGTPFDRPTDLSSLNPFDRRSPFEKEYDQMMEAKERRQKGDEARAKFRERVGSFIGGTLISALIYNSDINFNILDNLNNPWILNDIQTVIFILFIGVLGSLGIISLIGAYRIGSPLIKLDLVRSFLYSDVANTKTTLELNFLSKLNGDEIL